MGIHTKIRATSLLRNPITGAAALLPLICAAIVAASMLVPTSMEARAEGKYSHKSVLHIPATATLPVRREVTIGLNKTMVVELPVKVQDVHISHPENLDAVVRTNRRAYLIGAKVGQANAFFFDDQGQQVLILEVKIERDLAPVAAMLERLIPGSQIELSALNDNVMLTGRVPNAVDASRAAKIVGRLVEDEDGEKIINMLGVDAKEQVLLKVTIAEMQRTVIKQLGIDITDAIGAGAAFVTSGNLTLNKLTNLKFPFNDKDVVSTALGSALWQTPNNQVRATIRALEQDGVIRTLAEPTLTAISGETASFLAGGEFPIPIAQDNNRVSVEFKPFGVGLSFTPVVLSEGRISMKVSTEVSEITNEASITLSFVTIPGLKVRRAESTVELPSGGSLVMAGLISDETKQAMTGLPGIKNLPVLGALFRSRDYEKKETELVVIVTPYVVDPTARSKLARPDDGFSPASDGKGYLMGHLNRIYGREPEHMPVGGYKGDVGYIVE